MSNKRGKQQEQQLYQQSQAAQAAIQPTPLETLINQNAMNFLTDQAAGKDVKDTRGFEGYTNLYNNAANAQQGERQSDGLLTLAGKGNPQQAAMLKQYLDARRQQDASGELQNAYGMAQANATGTGFQEAALANSRNLGKAGLAQQAYSQYAAAQAAKVPWWQRLAGIAVGGLSAAAKGGL